MASEITLETRTISGTGLLRVPSTNKVNRIYTLYTQVLRNPKSPYLNLKSNPPEGFFARVTCVKDDVVFSSFDIKYQAQAFEFYADMNAQILTAIKCEYKGLLQTFINLGNALGLIPISVTDTIADIKPLELSFNEFRVVCYSTTALKITLKAIPIDKCDPTDDDAQPQPALPPKRPRVPDDEPLDIDPPYDDDDVISKKSSLDEEFTPPPLGGDCQQAVAKFTAVITTQGSPPTPSINRVLIFGPLGEFRVKPGQSNVLQAKFKGIPGQEGCGAFEFRDIVSYGGATTILSWNSISFPEQ